MDASGSMPLGAAQAKAKKLRHKLLGGSLTLLAGSGLVGITNLVYNVVTARLLGPTGFAHATAVYTLLMLASAITLSFQVVCAKYVASHETAGREDCHLRQPCTAGLGLPESPWAWCCLSSIA